MVEPIILNCPYCGESFETSVDTSAGSQHYVEDCAVCCRPIEVAVRVGADGEVESIDTRSDRE